MFAKQRFFALFLFSLFFLPSTSSNTELAMIESKKEQDNEKYKNMTLMDPKKGLIKNIIFDLNEVLFQTSKATYLKKIYHIIPYSLHRLFRREPFNITLFFNNAISDIPGECLEQVAYHNGKALPPIMNDWQCGRDVYEIVIAHINAKKIPRSDKRFLRSIAETFFNPEQFVKSRKAINHVVQIVKDLKEAGYKLYVLSNWDAQSFPIFMKQQQEIMDLFDGIMISGDEGLVKPNVKFFERCIETFKLSPSESLFIDDQLINVQGAQAAGMSAFVFDAQDRPGIISSLQSYNIIDRAD